MTWNVFIHNPNSREIEEYNVFNHGSFYAEVKKLKKEINSEIEFSEELRRVVMYYFWSKYEWETVITTWPPYIDMKELNRLNEEKDECWCTHERYPICLNVRLETGDKIDVYRQLMLNWKAFVNYVWNGELK